MGVPLGIRQALWQYGLWSFQGGGTKLERFLHKNQHTQKKLSNFKFWINGKLLKSAKIRLSKSIFYVKNHLKLSQFFFIEEYQFRSTFFDSQFLNHFITTMMPYFRQLAINPKLKIQQFPLGMLILRQKSFQFRTPV